MTLKGFAPGFSTHEACTIVQRAARFAHPFSHTFGESRHNVKAIGLGTAAGRAVEPPKPPQLPTEPCRSVSDLPVQLPPAGVEQAVRLSPSTGYAPGAQGLQSDRASLGYQPARHPVQEVVPLLPDPATHLGPTDCRSSHARPPEAPR
jgi:hypothetical protein